MSRELMEREEELEDGDQEQEKGWDEGPGGWKMAQAVPLLPPDPAQLLKEGKLFGVIRGAPRWYARRDRKRLGAAVLPDCQLEKEKEKKKEQGEQRGRCRYECCNG